MTKVFVKMSRMTKRTSLNKCFVETILLLNEKPRNLYLNNLFTVRNFIFTISLVVNGVEIFCVISVGLFKLFKLIFDLCSMSFVS